MTDKRTLLLIDDNAAHGEVFRAALLDADNGPFEGEIVSTLSHGMARLRKTEIWAIFANLSLPDSQGLDTLDRLMQASSDVPKLLLCAGDQLDIAMEGMRRGAKDYLLEGHIDSYSLCHAIRNMAERRMAEEVIFTEKERAQVTLNSIGDAVLSTDISGNVTYLNVVAEQMTGWSDGEAQGKPLAEVFHIIDGATREPAPNPMEIAVRTDSTVGLNANCVLLHRDGSESSIEDSAAPIHDRSGAITGAVIVFHDVSMSKSKREEMTRLAQHDSLTDLPNRLLLTDRLSQGIARSRRNSSRLAVMYMDLDGFKQVNDSLGHSVGDRILKSIATCLRGCVRNSDTVSRQGGDEFVVLLSEISHAADASIMAKKMLNAMASLPALGETNLRVTVSVGLSTYPEDGEDADTLIKNADTAMYEAKETGRNTYRFYRKNMNVLDIDRQCFGAGLRPQS